MNKTLAKWFRKLHRWFAIPIAIAIVLALVVKLFGDPASNSIWDKIERLPSILMLVMAVTGTYLFLLPFFVKAKRNKRIAPAPKATEQ